MTQDRAQGWDAVVDEFIHARSDSGAEIVRSWAQTLPKGATVLDVGCGTGWPITEQLVGVGLEVYAVDAAPKMVARFRKNFPDVPVLCEPVETSTFFGRGFDAIVSIGLIFLLPEEAQSKMIMRLSDVLEPKGQLLLSAPQETGAWEDTLTGRRSVSLGRAEYILQFEQAGLTLHAEYDDPGGSHYYALQKR